MDDINRKIQEVYEQSIINENFSFVDDTKMADKIFKDMEIVANKIVMKTLIPAIKKEEEKINKKYKTSTQSTIFVKNLGTAFFHDILRQLVGQQILSVTSGLKRIKR